MKYRNLGRTGIKVSELGFGCGSIGGLMVRGEHRDQLRVVARAIESGINLLNPSSGTQVQAGFPFQDYRRLIDVAADNEVGVIAIRILAAGALSGTTERHPVAAQSVSPIATGDRFEEDVERAQAFRFLIEDGYVSSLVEAAVRFAISKDEISTALIGISNLEQLEQAVAYDNKGPLPAEAFDHLNEVWASG